MAKSKKNIKNFKKALLSNTVYLKDEEPENKQSASENAIEIEPEILEDFRTLAKYMEISESELIHQALTHFLRIKAMKLEDAKKSNKS